MLFPTQTPRPQAWDGPPSTLSGAKRLSTPDPGLTFPQLLWGHVTSQDSADLAELRLLGNLASATHEKRVQSRSWEPGPWSLEPRAPALFFIIPPILVKIIGPPA